MIERSKKPNLAAAFQVSIVALLLFCACSQNNPLNADFNQKEMNPNGTNKQRLTPPSDDVWSAAWSPDGQKIAYVVVDGGGRGKVKLINPDGSDTRELTGWFGDLRRVTWSRNSQQIAFEAFDPGDFTKIYVISREGFGLKVLFEYGSSPCYFPAWSPSDDQIAFASFNFIEGTNYSNIFVHDLNSNRSSRVTFAKTFDYYPS
ncbi:MAG: hypothetical protein ONB46_11710 [candidate division KSB1 bacterium]|nr:hypothetical protein [candidate division KSB1 bacterium]MDZ7366660.1 hypothetical protein [candidate division KSB1 bacterium]MDZ7404670.1 hypothetical protein [candidate division KSB1 bacterium]